MDIENQVNCLLWFRDWSKSSKASIHNTVKTNSKKTHRTTIGSRVAWLIPGCMKHTIYSNIPRFQWGNPKCILIDPEQQRSDLESRFFLFIKFLIFNNFLIDIYFEYKTVNTQLNPINQFRSLMPQLIPLNSCNFLNAIDVCSRMTPRRELPMTPIHFMIKVLTYSAKYSNCSFFKNLSSLFLCSTIAVRIFFIGIISMFPV